MVSRIAPTDLNRLGDFSRLCCLSPGIGRTLPVEGKGGRVQMALRHTHPKTAHGLHRRVEKKQRRPVLKQLVQHPTQPVVVQVPCCHPRAFIAISTNDETVKSLIFKGLRRLKCLALIKNDYTTCPVLMWLSGWGARTSSVSSTRPISSTNAATRPR